ncbi:hypothetical protein V1477_019640 [Vespula maculifrons]|uniref:Uncharacterized protein n=1 Tax=Vespula maculifrons TaxID=7453 RepID=A0ABD2AR00_VESMC
MSSSGDVFLAESIQRDEWQSLGTIFFFYRDVERCSYAIREVIFVSFFSVRMNVFDFLFVPVAHETRVRNAFRQKRCRRYTTWATPKEIEKFIRE